MTTEPRRYTLRHGPEGQRHRLDVVVYPTLDQMRHAARAHAPHAADPDALAYFQASLGTSRHLGVMRLNDEHLNASIVVHEAVHAAVAYVCKLHRKRIVIDSRSTSDSTMGQREEDLAYAVQGMASALLAELGLTA